MKLRWLHRATVGCKTARMIQQFLVLLIAPGRRAFVDLLFNQRPDACAACLAAEVATKGISACETTPAAPVGATIRQRATTDVLLLPRVQSFVPVLVVLPRKSLFTHSALKRPLVCMSSFVRVQVVPACEGLAAHWTFERCRIFLLWPALCRDGGICWDWGQTGFPRDFDTKCVRGRGRRPTRELRLQRC